MPVPVYADYTTTGYQAPIIIDYAVCPFSMTVGAYILGGPCNYGIQFTLDDVNNPGSVSGAVWFNDPVLPPGTIASGVTNYSSPILALRVYVASITGTLCVKVVQAFENS